MMGINRESAKRYWPSVVLIGGSIATAVIFINAHTVEKPLSQLELALFTVLWFFLNLAGSFILGKAQTEAQAEAKIRPLARGALRRVVTLNGALDRLARRIRDERPVFVSSEDESLQVMVVNREVSRALETLGAIVQEQIATARDTIKDWTDILPDDANDVLQQYNLAAEVARLKRDLGKAQLEAQVLEDQGARKEEETKLAERRVDELTAELARTQKELETKSRASTITIPSGTIDVSTVAPPSQARKVEVPEDFPAQGSIASSIAKSAKVKTFTKSLEDLAKRSYLMLSCVACGAMIGGLNGGGNCSSCGRFACGDHLTTRERDPSGPRCVECWEKERKKEDST